LLASIKIKYIYAPLQNADLCKSIAG